MNLYNLIRSNDEAIIVMPLTNYFRNSKKNYFDIGLLKDNSNISLKQIGGKAVELFNKIELNNEKLENLIKENPLYVGISRSEGAYKLRLTTYNEYVYLMKVISIDNNINLKLSYISETMPKGEKSNNPISKGLLNRIFSIVKIINGY